MARTETMKPHFLIITDLDGTLLDARTYAWEPAAPALAALKSRGVPVVFCTSKTLAEVVVWAERLGLSGPHIVENGGGIAWPRDLPLPEGVAGEIEEGWTIVPLGAPYDILRAALRDIAFETGCRLSGLGDWTVEELAALTGLPAGEAELARRRRFDEPFRIVGGDEEACGEAVRLSAAKHGLSVARGGRFRHLFGHGGKGAALERLLDLLPCLSGRWLTVGLGDAENDLPMLDVVDIPILVPRPDGTYDPAVSLPGLRRAEKPGPEGWGRAVLSVLAEVIGESANG